MIHFLRFNYRKWYKAKNCLFKFWFIFWDVITENEIKLLSCAILYITIRVTCRTSFTKMKVLPMKFPLCPHIRWRSLPALTKVGFVTFKCCFNSCTYSHTYLLKRLLYLYMDMQARHSDLILFIYNLLPFRIYDYLCVNYLCDK